MVSYNEKFFMGAAKVLDDSNQIDLINIENTHNYVTKVAEGDSHFKRVTQLDKLYPPGLEVEGQIVSIQSYGLFVDFGLSGSGLIHKSNFNCVDEDAVDEAEYGDWVIVEVLKYNPKHSRYELKLVDI